MNIIEGFEEGPPRGSLRFRKDPDEPFKLILPCRKCGGSLVLIYAHDGVYPGFASSHDCEQNTWTLRMGEEPSRGVEVQ